MSKLIFAIIVIATILKSNGAFSQQDPRCSDSSALRQTFILIDNNLVVPGDLSKNARWVREVLRISDSAPSSNNAMMPLERIHIYMMDRATGELAPVYLGCSANLTQEQIEDLQKGDGIISSLFGTDSASREADIREAFQDMLLKRFINLASNTQNNQSTNTIFEPLGRLRNLINLSEGVPRIFVLSQPEHFTAKDFKSNANAKKQGISDGLGNGADLARAEVYVVSFGSSSSTTQSYLEGYLLASKGFLAGMRSNGTPTFQRAPDTIYRFSGEFDFGEIYAPVQIRIAADNEGNLVNSWIEVTTGQSKASPITGKLICKSATDCIVRGDGRSLGQSWNPIKNPKVSELFNEKFGWSGFRYFEMKITDDRGEVKISDPKGNVTITRKDGSKKEINDFSFRVTKAVKQEF